VYGSYFEVLSLPQIIFKPVTVLSFSFFFRKCLTRWHKAKPDGMRHIVVRSSIKRGQPKTKPAKGSKNFFRVLTGNNMGCLYAGQHQFLFRGRATSKKSGFLLSAIQ